MLKSRNQLIECCNIYVWGHIYPGEPGEPASLPENSLQHRDIVRTYFAGMMDLMNEVGYSSFDLYERGIVTDLITEMIDPIWLPGPAFSRRAWQQEKARRSRLN